VRWLEHLASVEGVSVRVVILQAVCDLMEDCRGCFAEWGRGVWWKVGETSVEAVLCVTEDLEEIV
jgi:hypothetical protein